jgi:hypothetical protein
MRAPRRSLGAPETTDASLAEARKEPRSCRGTDQVVDVVGGGSRSHPDGAPQPRRANRRGSAHGSGLAIRATVVVVGPRITITYELAELELIMSGSAADRRLARPGPNRRPFLDRLPYRFAARGAATAPARDGCVPITDPRPLRIVGEPTLLQRTVKVEPAGLRGSRHHISVSAAEPGLLPEAGKLVRVRDRVDPRDPAVLHGQADRGVDLAGEVDPDAGRAVEPRR